MLASVLGIVTGLILGLTGAGGGILAVPALVIGLGHDMTQATPVALLAVGAAALVGALDGLRHNLVRYRAALVMAVCGALTSRAGIALAHALPEQWLRATFALVMMGVALRMLNLFGRKTTASRQAAGLPCRLDPATARLRWTPACALTLAAIGAVTGLLAGMLGVGGGFVIVPALRRFSDIGIQAIIGTSLMLVSLVSLAAAWNGLSRGTTLPADAWVFCAAAIGGMLLGRALASRLSGPFLQRLFALLALGVALLMLARAWAA